VWVTMVADPDCEILSALVAPREVLTIPGHIILRCALTCFLIMMCNITGMWNAFALIITDAII